MGEVAVLINTWDGYADAWPMMSHSLKKYWPDCPWPIYWMCNETGPPMGIPIHVPGETNWGKMMRTALRQLLVNYNHRFFLFLHGDYWLVSRVKTKSICLFAEYLESGWADHIQIVPSWDVMKRALHGNDFPKLWRVADNSAYRTSNQASFWRTEVYAFLVNGVSGPWEFETIKPSTTTVFDCYSLSHLISSKNWPMRYVYRHLDEYDLEPIVKGRWTQAAVDYCIKEDLPYNFKAGGQVCP